MPVGIDTADLYILEGLKKEGLEIVNGWDVTWDARLLKSPDELEIIEMSAALADGCYESIVDKIRSGIRESEIVAEIYGWLLRNGCDRIPGDRDRGRAQSDHPLALRRADGLLAQVSIRKAS